MRGILFDGESSASRAIEAQLLPTGALQIKTERQTRIWKLDELVIADPISGCPAVVELPDGSRLEIDDPAPFYDALAALDGSRRGWIHAIEQHWIGALLCLAATIALVAWAMTDGIPLATRFAASIMPASVNEVIGREGLRIMDQFFFEPSSLEDEHKQILQERFDDIVAAVGDGSDYILAFRSSEAIGPNAFALPAGVVIITDQLIELAEDDRGIAGVLAHEVGHVTHRHALRSLIQGSLSAGLLIAITGDIGSATNFAAGLPTILVNAAYSRDFEREADEVAFEYLDARGIDPQELGELLMRIDEHYSRNPDQVTLLDSHPASRERLEAAGRR